jgi:hypothetical protein
MTVGMERTVRFLGILWGFFGNFMIYFNFKSHKANHVIIENEQYYGIIRVICVHV